MLFITTDYNKVHIKDVEAYFNNIVDKSVFNNKICKYIIKYVDSAVYLGNDIVETPLGKTTIDNISTGCKAVLLIVTLCKNKTYIPITECGINAIKCIFDIANRLDLYAYTNYGFVMDKDIKCIINGNKITNNEQLYHSLEG